MFGRQPKSSDFEHQLAFDVSSYQGHLQAKLAELRDLVETNLAEAATHQKTTYDKHSTSRTFKVGDLVWLSVPTAGKLDPRWEGNWKITAVRSPVTMEISDGNRKKVTHINRLHRRVQPSPHESQEIRQPQLSWTSSQTEHFIVPPEAPTPSARRNPPRNRRPPNYFDPT